MKNTPALIPADRQARICRRLQEQGTVRVARLSDLLGVSEITIRRDLDTLEQLGLLERAHGGAITSRLRQVEPPYAHKDHKQRLEKESIGRAAAALVEDGDTLLVNSGSTTAHLLRFLQGRDLRVITSNVAAVPEIRNRDIELILIGGVYRYQSNSLVGGLAALLLNQVFGTRTFIGVDGVSSKFGLTTPVQQVAQINTS